MNTGAVQSRIGGTTVAGRKRAQGAVGLTLVLAAFLGGCGQPSAQHAPEAVVSTEFEQVVVRRAVPEASDFFGGALAASGSTLAVGAWGQDDETGAVHVFTRDEATWRPVVELTPDDGVAGQRFGHAVALDEDVLAVGAVLHSGAAYRAGKVYVFERSDGGWRLAASLVPEGDAEYAQFGAALSLHDGVLVVGATGSDGRSVHVFERDRGWSRSATLQPSGSASDGRFGSSVAIHGGVVAVGAWRDEPMLFSAGAAADAYGDPYGGDPYGGDPYGDDPYGDDPYGDDPYADDGDWWGDGPEEGPGVVYLFERRTDGSWIEAQRLTPTITDAWAFGSSVALHEGRVAVGAPDADGTRATVHLFERDGDAWVERATLRPASPQARHFGTSVALDDRFVAIGTPGDDQNGVNAGAVYLHAFSLPDGDAVRVADPASTPNLHLGGVVALVDGYLVAGATGDPAGGTASGSTYLVRTPRGGSSGLH